MQKAPKITVTPSYDKAELEAQIQAEKDKINQYKSEGKAFEMETANKNYDYLKSFYESNFNYRMYEQK